MTTGRWAGRNPGKDEVRHDIWRDLEETGTVIGPAFSHSPNFVGADVAAWRLAQLPEWKAAKTVKCNPDPPQIPVRLRALYDGKLLFAPVPYLTDRTPYVRLDPEKLRARGVSFELAATSEGYLAHGEPIEELAATSEGYLAHGEPIEFEEIAPLDFCVCGSVAVGRNGGRTGKGAGFADLETGIFRELGLVGPGTPMATTVHSSQIVDDRRVVIEPHDTPLDYVATETELIVTGNTDPRPTGVSWEFVRPDQFDGIPFLKDLRDRIRARKGG